MIYQVQSVAITGGRQTFEFDNEHEAKCKVRELKDFGSIFIVKFFVLVSGALLLTLHFGVKVFHERKLCIYIFAPIGNWW